MDNLRDLIILADQFGVRNIADVVLKNEKFPIWSACCLRQDGSTAHHYGKGGLLQHTREVVDLCLFNNAYFKQSKVIDKHLYLAALFHDVGKIWDYEPKKVFEENGQEWLDYQTWTATPHKRIIHHISRSVLEWHDAYKAFGDDSIDEDSISHAILAHHGLPEWGSPVPPKTKLAWILHLCDSISSRVDDCDRIDLKCKPK